MSALGNARLAAEREVRQRLRGKSFYVSTALVVAAVIGVGVIHRVVAGDGGATETVAVTGAVPAGFREALDAGGSPDLEIETVAYDTLRTARAALGDGKVDAVVDAGRSRVLYPDGADDGNPALHAAVRQAWATAAIRASLSEAGLSPAEIDEALSPRALTAEVVDVDGWGNDGLEALVGMFAGVALFIALQMYGGFILMGVIEEKSTAVIEVLLARVRASQLLAGKVLGIGAVAVVQFVILVAAAVASLLISGAEVPGAVWAALPWTVVWFVAGFAMYAFLYAMAGAMVSRQEDAQSAAIPVNVLLISAYAGMFVFLGDPGHAASRVLSPVPPLAPLLMPMRIAAGEAALLEIALALLLVGATVVALAKVSGHIYTRLVLRRGGRVQWLEAVRAGH